VKHVFLVGCPRSGTTWLQLLLAQHGQVATARETHLFNGYLRHVDASWNAYQSQPERVGLHTLMSEDEYYDLLSLFARGVMDKIARSNPAATVVLEKTPSHVKYVPLILKILPDAHFIHIVRDPRSVVSSLTAASRSWGASWASADVLSNARLWRNSVTRGREIRQLTDRVREVRYEDLRGNDGAGVLDGLFAWLDLPSDRAFAARALEACEITRLRDGSGDIRGFESIKPRDSSFFRSGTTEAWKQDLSEHDIRVIEYAAGELIQEYGYRLHRATRGKRPFRVLVSDFVDRIESSVRHRTESAFRRLRALC
jgi:hypothetical protein